MSIAITSNADTFSSLSVLVILTAAGVCLSLFAARVVRTVNVRRAIAVGWIISLAILIFLIVTRNDLVNDEITWHMLGSRAADSLTGGTGAPVSYVAGKEGFVWLVGALYVVTGPAPLAVISMNFTLQALLIVSVARTTEIVTITYPGLREVGKARAVRIAAYSCALTPSIVLWVPMVLRETMGLFLISASMLLVLQFNRTRRFPYIAGAGLSLGLLYWVRGPVGLALMLAFFVGTALIWTRTPRLRRRITFILIPVVGLALVAGWAYATTAFGLTSELILTRLRELANIASSGYAGLPSDGGYLAIFGATFPRALLGPFIWEWRPTGSMVLAVVEGVTWVIALALAIVALWLAWRARRKMLAINPTDDGRLPILFVLVTLAVIAMLTFSVGNYGLLARLRPMAYISLLPLASVAASFLTVRFYGRTSTRRDHAILPDQRPIRLLVLHWGTRGGGPQMQAHLARALAVRDDVVLLLSYDRSSESSPALGALNVGRLLVGRQKPNRLRRIFSQPADVYRLLAFCRKNRVQAIYEVMDNPLQLLPRICSKAAGVKVLASVHDATRHRGEENYLLDLFSRLSLKFSDGVMTYSAAVARELKLRNLKTPIRIFQTVHGAFGVPIDEHAAYSDRPRSEPVIGFFGRIESYKGIGRLLDAVEELRQSVENVQLCIYGRGSLSTAELRRMETLATLHMGWLKEADIQGIIETFDILALPYDEASQSGVVGYALSAGIPIVCTPVAGLKEQVEDSEAGLIAAGMSGAAFADSLRQVLLSHDLWHKLSTNGIRSAKGNFSWERVANDINSAARSLVTTVM